MTIPGEAWQFIDGWAMDIGVGGTGGNVVVYHVGTNYDLYQWNGSLGWQPLNCRGKAIAVGPEGDLWFTGLEKGVFRRTRADGQINEYGNARGTDIGVDKNGVPWICYYVPGLTYRGIWRWNYNTSNWDEVEGYASKISGGDGNAWHVGGEGGIFKWSHNTWVKQPGWAQDIGVGPKDEAWHIGNDNRIYYLEDGRWVPVDGQAKRIDVGPRGMPWIVMDNGLMLRRV